MKALELIAGLFKPAADLIDAVHTSDEERGKLRMALYQLQGALTERIIGYETSLLESKTQIIVAEAKSGSWLTRNWRPLVMIWFAGLVGAHWLGFTPPNLSEETVLSLLGLVKIGIGGYVIGRSVEKVAPNVKGMFAKDT